MNRRFRNPLAALAGGLSYLAFGLAFAAPANAQHSRYWAWEYTSQSGQIAEFYNLTNASNTVTIRIFNPDGTERLPARSLTLRAREQVTITDATDGTTPPGLNLPVTVEGTPTTDRAYGIWASSTQSFSVITESDRQQFPGGSGRSAIHPQGNLYTDSWWGMYNYPSGGDETKDDYFYIFNPNAAATSLTFVVYNSAGTVIASPAPIALAGFATRKFYPKQDFGVGNGVQNIGIHMTATVGVAINVATLLGNQWSFDPGPYTTHDNVSGVYVPLQTSRNSTEYVWENSRSSDTLAAERVTNPNATSITCTKTIYVFDGTGPVGGNSYTVVETIPAFGTEEIGQPPLDAFKNETTSSPNFHSFRLSCTQAVAVHVSFEENVEVPLSPSQGLTNYWWGVRDVSRTRQIMFSNPSSSSVTIHCCSFYYVGAVLNVNTTVTGSSCGVTGPVPGTANPIVLGPFDALVTNITDSTIGPGFDSNNDQLITCFSAGQFALQLQEPDYGDVTPLVGGDFPPTAALVAEFSAFEEPDGRVLVEWRTTSEAGTIGYELQRFTARRGFQKVHRGLLPPAPGAEAGGVYRLIDERAELGERLHYQLVEVEAGGGRRVHGPFQIEVERWVGTGPRFEAKAHGASYAAAAVPTEDSARARLERLAAAGVLTAPTPVVPAPRLARVVAADDDDDDDEEPRAKVLAETEGLSFVGAVSLADALGVAIGEVRASLAAGRLRLLMAGKDVAYQTADDGLYFFAQATASPFTRFNVYQVQMRSGRRMSAAGKGGSAPVTPADYGQSTHVEQDVFAGTAASVDGLSDFWYWAAASAGTSGSDAMAITLDAPGLAANPLGGELAVNLFGATNTSAPQDHRVRVTVNGTGLGEAGFDGVGLRTVRFPIPASALAVSNTVVVTALLGPGVSGSVLYLDSVDLTYRRLFRAEGDRIAFHAEGSGLVTVGGFTSPAIKVLDVSAPLSPRLVAVAVTAGDGQQATFAVTTGARYLAVALPGVVALGAEPDAPSALSSIRDRDYVIITPTELAAGANQLAALRQASGRRVQIVDLEDVYDEYNYGMPSPLAVRSFLKSIYRKGRTLFVVFLGDGNYNYRGGVANPFPPLLTKTDFGLYASDARLGDVSGNDGVPEVAIGRIPALTNAEVEIYVAKLAHHEAALADGTQVLLVADNPDSAGDFTQNSEDLAALLHAGLDVSKVYLGPLAFPEARDALFSEYAAGPSFVNYVGHGALDRLAAEGLLFASEAFTILAGGGPLPTFASMTCAVGRFEVPGFVSLGESLVLSPTGGAVAAFAPAGLSFNEPAALLNQHLLKRLFPSFGSGPTFGEALIAALAGYRKQAGTQAFSFDFYNLLGDPAVRVR